jgi:DNA-binding transcriptional LysR family regulator
VLSNGIATLEERLGDKLFDRSPRGVNTCGLTTFATQLFQAYGLPVRTYPGEAASYQD